MDADIPMEKRMQRVDEVIKLVSTVCSEKKTVLQLRERIEQFGGNECMLFENLMRIKN